MLPDYLIREAVKHRAIDIDPFTEANVQPASVDLTLGDQFRKIKDPGYLDFPGEPRVWYGDFRVTQDPDDSYPVELDEWGRFRLNPLEFAIGFTVERIKLAANISARVEGRSSIGRNGLMVHVTAGFIDPGYDGNITLEFFNASPRPILLRPGIRICQISFTKMGGPAERPYGHPDLGSKYQGSDGVVGGKPDAER